MFIHVYVRVLYFNFITVSFIYVDRIYGVIFNGDYWSVVTLPMDIITL